VLWRRSKLGLHFDAAQRAAVAAWCHRHWPDCAAPTDMAARRTEASWN